MDHKRLSSPLLKKYQQSYDRDPQSRVFAPLAEIYRKLGMVDKALDIIRRGIKYHPTYVMGYLGLAFCYYDLGQEQMVYSTLRPFVNDNRENIRLQKLFGEVCFNLNYQGEALETYKHLLFLNPKDSLAAQRVRYLEDTQSNPFDADTEIQFVKSENSETFNEEKINIVPDETDGLDEWIQLDLPSSQKETKKEAFSEWKMNEKFSQVKKKMDDEISFAVNDYDENEEVATHTLVDLYLSQGYIDKGIDLLEKIFLQNPHDIRTKKRLEELKTIKDVSISQEVSTPEDEGRHHLMSIIDSKFSSPTDPEPDVESDKKAETDLEEKLWSFYGKIKNRADHHKYQR